LRIDARGDLAWLLASSRFSGGRRGQDRQDGPDSKEPEEHRPSSSTLKGGSPLRARANSDRAHVIYLFLEYPQIWEKRGIYGANVCVNSTRSSQIATFWSAARSLLHGFRTHIRHMMPLIQRRASPPPVEAGFAPAGPRATNPIPFATLEREHAEIAGELHDAFDRVPLYRQPSLRALAVAPNELRCAEAWAREELSLPVSPKLEPAEVVAVANGVLERV
jgi:hypothetical protein